MTISIQLQKIELDGQEVILSFANAFFDFIVRVRLTDVVSRPMVGGWYTLDLGGEES